MHKNRVQFSQIRGIVLFTNIGGVFLFLCVLNNSNMDVMMSIKQQLLDTIKIYSIIYMIW